MDQHSSKLQTVFYSLCCYDTFFRMTSICVGAKEKKTRGTWWPFKHLHIDDWMECGLTTSVYLDLKNVFSIISSHGISSVQFSRSVVSDSLWPHGLQHTRPHCPSPTPGVYSSSCPLSRWCHPTILSGYRELISCIYVKWNFAVCVFYFTGGMWDTF